MSSTPANAIELSTVPKLPVLPPELWLQIASSLNDDPRSLLRLVLVNHAFNSIMQPLATRAQFKHVHIDTSGDRYEALGELHELFTRLGSTTSLASNVETLVISDLLLQGFTLFRESYPMDNGAIGERPSRSGMLRRMQGMRRELALSKELVRSAFDRCQNVSKLELLFNGPWFQTSATSPTTTTKAYYPYEETVFTALDNVCHSFSKELKEMHLTLLYTGHIRQVLKAPIFTGMKLHTLDLSLLTGLPSKRLFAHEGSDFLHLFASSLHVLRLRFGRLGTRCIEVLFGGTGRPEFPHLQTLELWDGFKDRPFDLHQTYMRGYAHLTEFLRRTPALTHFHLYGPSPAILPIQDAFEFPSEVSISEFGTDQVTWAAHSTHLNPIMVTKKPSTLHFFERMPLELFIFARGAQFLMSVTTLHLNTMEFPLHDFATRFGQYFKAVHTLVVTCNKLREDLDLDYRDAAHINELRMNHLSEDDEPPSVLPVDVFSSLNSVDIIRVPSSRVDPQLPDDGCCCKEFRLWSALHAFAFAFPSVRVVGGKSKQEVRDFMERDSQLCQKCLRERQARSTTVVASGLDSTSS